MLTMMGEKVGRIALTSTVGMESNKQVEGLAVATSLK